MKTVSMSGSPRENVGKKDAKRLRYQGDVPCVLYGGKDQVHFSMSEKDFKPIIFTPEVFLLNISINGTVFNAILQDIQYHPVTDKILHADFLEIIPGKPIIIGIPVVFTGKAPGVLLGGRLVKKLRKLRAKALAEDLPDNLLVDISKLNIGDNVTIKDITFDKVEFLENANSEVVGVKTARNIEEEEEEEEEEGEEGVEGAEGGEAKAEGGEAKAEDTK